MSKNKTIIGTGGKDTQVEVFSDQEIEPIVSQEFKEGQHKEMFDQEAFMNEMVEIEVAETTDDNAPTSFVLNVNNVNQPIVRGIPMNVKRKYVEVLARCKETKYKQPMRDMANPEAGNQLNGSTALTYPFTVLRDSPRGMAWLRAVKAEQG